MNFGSFFLSRNLFILPKLIELLEQSFYNIYRIYSDVTSSIHNISKLCLFSFYPINLARGLLILLIATINQHLLSLISIGFLKSILLISADIHYFLVLTLGLISSFCFSFLGWKLRILIWDFSSYKPSSTINFHLSTVFDTFLFIFLQSKIISNFSFDFFFDSWAILKCII